MERQNNNVKDIIKLIEKATTEGKFTGIAVRDGSNKKIIYGEMLNGFIKNPFELDNINKNTLCQDLLDSINSIFSEKIVPGYAHSFNEGYKYFIQIGDKVLVSFPDDLKYQGWICNQIQIDRENQLDSKKSK